MIRHWLGWLGILLVTTSLQAEPLDTVVAIVNDEVITASELDEQVSLLRQQLMAKQVAMPDEKTLKKQVLQHLIDVDVQLQLAKHNHLTVEPAEVNSAIDSIAAQHQLTREQLQTTLQTRGMSWKQYQESIRKEILMARIQQQAMGKEVTVTQEQVEAYLKQTQAERLANQQMYHVQNIVIPLPEAPTSDQLTHAREKAEGLLKKLQQGADFSQMAIAESSGELALEGGDLGERHLAELPEVFAKQVVTMKVGDVQGPIRTGNGFQLLKLVGVSGASERHVVTKTHVRHILIKPSPGMTDKEGAAQLAHLHQQLKSGGDFARLAKQYSMDAVSAAQGGDLGWVTPGVLVPEFEKVVEALPLHQISAPTKSRYGWHLVEVLARKTEDDTVAFEKQQVQQFLKQRKLTEWIQKWQQQVRAQAYIQITDKQLV